MNEEQSQAASEWVAFSAYFATVIWSRWTGESQRAIESKDHVIATDSEGLWPERPIPSPDGKYIAAFREYKFGDPELRIFDVQRRSWVNFGKITIHPDFENWLYIQPNWNPWFADSSRLVFIQDSKIVIASPAGYKMDELSIEGPSGLPTPSPNGKFIAYVTYTARPMNHRPDLKFWGGTTVMTVSVAGNRKSQPVTEKNPDEVYDLKWLNDSSVIFDRVADDFRFEHARIWKASLKN
jgi:Tol biopolymer transport system component